MLLIFDCDGVLRSISWQAIYSSYIAIAKHLSIDPGMLWKDIADFRQWYDADWKNNLKRMGVPREEKRPDINAVFHEVFDRQIQVFPWAEAILKELSEYWTLALLSNSSSLSVRSGLGSLTKYFSVILGCEEINNLKPDPEGIKLILSKLNEKKDDSGIIIGTSHVIMIGDTTVDIKVGKNAGVKTAGVLWGLGTKEELERCDPNLILSDHRELLRIV